MLLSSRMATGLDIASVPNIHEERKLFMCVKHGNNLRVQAQNCKGNTRNRTSKYTLKPYYQTYERGKYYTNK